MRTRQFAIAAGALAIVTAVSEAEVEPDSKPVGVLSIKAED